MCIIKLQNGVIDTWSKDKQSFKRQLKAKIIIDSSSYNMDCLQKERCFKFSFQPLIIILISLLFFQTLEELKILYLHQCLFIIIKPNINISNSLLPRKVWKMMNSSLLTPSSSSHVQTPATAFDHEDFLDQIFASSPWPSDEAHPPPPPPPSSDGFLSRHQQIMMMPISSHHQNEVVDGSSVHAVYNGFSAGGSLPFNIPQV